MKGLQLLRDAVIDALEKGGMRAAVMSAVLESFEKNKELGKQ